MKKLVVLVLALVMVVAMGFANVNGTSGQIDVKVTVLPHVVVEAPSNVEFTYDPASQTVTSKDFDLTVKANYDYELSVAFDGDHNSLELVESESNPTEVTGNDTYTYTVKFINNGDEFWKDAAGDYTATIVYTVSAK